GNSCQPVSACHSAARRSRPRERKASATARRVASARLTSLRRTKSATERNSLSCRAATTASARACGNPLTSRNPSRRQGDRETGRQGDKEQCAVSPPCLPVSLSPCLLSSVQSHML